MSENTVSTQYKKFNQFREPSDYSVDMYVVPVVITGTSILNIGQPQISWTGGPSRNALQRIDYMSRHQ